MVSWKVLSPLVFLSALALAGCGSSDNGGSGGSGGGDGDSSAPVVGAPAQTHPEGADLSSLGLADSTAPSLGRVAVTGIPADLSSADLYAEFYPLDPPSTAVAAASGGPGFVPLFTLDDTVYLATPLAEGDGSSIVVTVTDGNSRSETFALELSPLPPPQPGVFHDLIDEMDNLLRVSTKALGKEYPDEWEMWRDNGFNLMPVYLVPIVRTWLALVDTENPDSIRNQLADLEPEVLELLERMYAGSGVPEAIRERADSIAAGESLLDEAGDLDMLRNSTITWPDGQDPDALSGQVQGMSGSPGRFTPLGVPPIADADLLAPLLELYADYRFVQESAERFDDTVGAYVRVVTLAGAVAAGGTSGGTGAVAVQRARVKALGLASNAVTGFSTMTEVAQWFLPCCIPSMRIDLDPAGGVIGQEDALPNQVRLAAATGVAESIGVDVTKEVFTRLAGALTSAAVGDFMEALYGQVAKEIVDFGMSGPLSDLLDNFPPGADVVFIWPGIDLMSTEPQRWLEVETDTFGSGGEPILEQATTSTDRMEFRLVTPRAFERQTSQLRFRTDNTELRASPALETVPVDLSYINIEMDPPVLRITEDELGETLPFTVYVRNSILAGSDMPWVDIPLALEPAIGALEFVGSGDEDGSLVFNYEVPEEFPPDTIVEVTATSISESGIRAPANQPPWRSGTLFITADAPSVYVLPRFACLGAGETRQFQALDRRTGEAVDVAWDATSGSVSDNGLYTAGGGTGGATVTASAGGRTSSASITLGDCSCFFNASATAPAGVSDGYAGSQGGIVLAFDETGYTHIYFFGEVDDPSSATVMMLPLDPPLPIGGSGSVTTTISVPMITRLRGELLSSMRLEDGSELPPLQFQVTSLEHPNHEGNIYPVLSGRISGQAWHRDMRPEGVQENVVAVEIDVNGVFAFRPPGPPTLNCDNVRPLGDLFR